MSNPRKASGKPVHKDDPPAGSVPKPEPGRVSADKGKPGTNAVAATHATPQPPPRKSLPTTALQRLESSPYAPSAPPVPDNVRPNTAQLHETGGASTAPMHQNGRPSVPAFQQNGRPSAPTLHQGTEHGAQMSHPNGSPSVPALQRSGRPSAPTLHQGTEPGAPMSHPNPNGSPSVPALQRSGRPSAPAIHEGTEPGAPMAHQDRSPSVPAFQHNGGSSNLKHNSVPSISHPLTTTNPQPQKKSVPSLQRRSALSRVGLEPQDEDEPEPEPRASNFHHATPAHPDTVIPVPATAARSASVPHHSVRINSRPEFHTPPISSSVPDFRKPTKRVSRDDYVFLTPPHAGDPQVKAWPVRDSHEFHTPPLGSGVVVKKDHGDRLPPPARKGSFLYSSEDENMGLSKRHETEPLLKPHSAAQDILNRMIGTDRDANRFDDTNWWCFRREMYAMPSCFSNQTFRQSFASKILIIKAIQVFLMFVSSIVLQMIWTWDTEPPIYYTFIIQYFWITPSVFAAYLCLLFFVRVFHIGRLPPRNWICYVVMTLLLVSLNSAASVGLGILVSAISPVLPLALTISYVVFYFLMIPKEWRFRLDILERKMYLCIPAVSLLTCLLAWSLVFGLLQIPGSIFLIEFSAINTMLINGAISVGLTGLILLIELYRMKRIIEGSYISLMADDEALFASFFV